MPEEYQSLLVWLSVISLATFLISLLSLPWLVSLLPEDYFLYDNRQVTTTRHPAIRMTLLMGKNTLGALLLIAGILMLFLPGQGLLTIAIAAILLDYPGKYRLERRLAATPAIFNGLNWLRRKAGKPPLKKPEHFH